MSVVNNNLLLAADAAVSSYQVQRSLRFNSADSAYLNRTPSVAGNRKTWTFACWIKNAFTPSAYPRIFSAGTTTANTIEITLLASADSSQLRVLGDTASTRKLYWTTVNTFRDPGSWFHLVVALDTTQAVAADRLGVYINGTRITTSGISGVLPSQNDEFEINNTSTHYVGRSGPYSEYMNGYLADVHFIDGQALTPSSFTETNATTGQLVPKAYTGSYGTNGFKLNFSDNSAATLYTLGADSRTDGALNGNNGTLTNGPTYSSANGGTIVFDGSNDWVSAPVIDIASAGTVSAWFYKTGTGNPDASNVVDLVSNINSSGSAGWSFGLNVSTNKVDFYIANNGGYGVENFSTQTISNNTWYNVVVTYNGSNKIIYINGTQDSTFSSSVNGTATTSAWSVGGRNTGARNFQGNIPQASIYNRVLSASEITQNYNALVGRFGGTSTGSIVTDGMVLNLDAGNIASYPGTGTTWTDISLRKNNWTPNNLSVTAGAGNDSLTDTPTSYGTDTGAGGEVRGNYTVLNALTGGGTVSNGNLDYVGVAGGAQRYGTIGINSGKWYWEILTTAGSGGSLPLLGIGNNPNQSGLVGTYGYYGFNGNKYADSTALTYGASYGVNDVVGIAFDSTAGTLTFYKNGVSQGVAYSGISGTYFPYVRADSGTSGSCNFGQRPFAYAAPSGFKALCDTNIAEGTITTSGTFTGNASADGPFVYLNGVPTAMTINSNAVTFATHADKLANGFKVRSSSGSYNTAGSNTYSITTTGAKFKYARAQPNP